MDNKLHVSSSPHLHSGASTTKIMLDVIIALIPAGIMSVVLFGFRSVAVIFTCVLSCILFEYGFQKISKKPTTVCNLSAVVTGLLLAYNLPVGIPLWMAVIGCAAAIIVVKQCFGGIGQNFANPAIVGRIVMLVSFSSAMSTFPPTVFMADAVTTATPMQLLANDQTPDVLSLLWGNHQGTLGETCAIALIIGGLYLIIKRVISPVIPVCFMGSVFVMALIKSGFDINFAVCQLLSGGLILGAFFMATDYTTSPINFKGKIVFALGCGIITACIRFWANLPEGVSYAILLMNITVPLIERITTPRPFGWEGIKK
ncbi:MAG: RnfABCDGE type electron transport complex subunit D [Clostridia bacterium]|nr:RnfABCDGE type electron transport complex subunit D [Clostridia bacterium]